MRCYAVRKGYIPSTKLEAFEQMRSLIADLPDLEPSHRVSCHVLTRVLAARFPDVTAVDGWFAGKGNEHSWLDMGDGIVADVYPIGGAVPFIVDTSGMMNPWNRLYMEQASVMKGKTGVDETVSELLEWVSRRS